MIAAKIVSRASAAAASPPASIIETMSATSITVTASASTSVPKGSPTRWATTSAWCTAASTQATNPAPSAKTSKGSSTINDAASSSQPVSGLSQVRIGR